MNNLDMYFQALIPLVQTFNVSHFYVSPPKSQETTAATSHAGSGDVAARLWSAGVFLTEQRPGPKLVVAEVAAGSSADEQGVRPGQQVFAVGPAGSDAFRLVFGADINKTRSVIIYESGQAPPRCLDHHQLSDYPISFSSFSDQSVQALKRDLMASKQRFVVVDLRENWGGLTSNCQNFCGIFCGPQVPIGQQISRHWRHKIVSSGPKIESRPTAFLIGPGTASSAEMAAHALKSNGRAILVGHRTAGEVLGSAEFVLPDSGRLSLPISDFIDPQGVRLEGIGVEPDYRPLTETSLDNCRLDSSYRLAVTTLSTSS